MPGSTGGRSRGYLICATVALFVGYAHAGTATYRVLARSVELADGQGLKLRITPYGSGMVRIQYARPGEDHLPDHALEMVASHKYPGKFKVTRNAGTVTLEDAIDRVGRMIGMAIDWTEIGQFLPDSDDPAYRRSALASSFVAALELARRGRLDIRQEQPFASLKVRAA